MRAYYDDRAGEYDDWWLGTGLFADRDRPGWADEVEQLIALIRALPPARTLDIGCGTGFLTRHLPGEVVGVDQSKRMLDAARRARPGLQVVQSDASSLPFPDDEFDRVFTSHVYGHLRPEQRKRFLSEARRVGRSLVVVDTSQRASSKSEEWQERRLNDGTTHRIYKRFFTGPGLAQELDGGTVVHEGRWFVVVTS
jgi:demethylmenaquinone methyltransferase/2-methoxy-6-polyprenyl-1,4-benzoquinol methylase